MNLSGDFLSLLLMAGEEARQPVKPSILRLNPNPEQKGFPPNPLPGEGNPADPAPGYPAPEKNPEPPPSPATAPESPLLNPVDLPRFSGVVIDARGLAMKPALIPRVLDGKGQELYRGKYVPRRKLPRMVSPFSPAT